MHGTLDKPSYWAACQILSHRGHLVRSDIEKADHGTLLPTFVRVWVKNGARYEKQFPLFPGYLLFQTEPDKWGEVTGVHGVLKVLANCGNASRITEQEISRILVDDFTGIHNRTDAPKETRGRYSRRRRRPRPGKRGRAMW